MSDFAIAVLLLVVVGAMAASLALFVCRLARKWTEEGSDE